jgi:large subunit ribosomal protein L15
MSSVNLHSLAPARGSVRNDARKGRGTGSGMGGTSTRGHKGAQSRSGYKRKIGFEGGQMPLQRRVPKFGFKNIDKVYFKVINLSLLQTLAEENPGQELNVDFFRAHGLASKRDLIKILAKGELSSPIKTQAHAYSGSAKEAIENAGGTTAVLFLHATDALAAENASAAPTA